MIAKKFVGSWIIDETSEWEPDFLHMIKTTRIEIAPDGLGRLYFGAVEAELDLEPDEWNSKEILQFTFETIICAVTCGFGRLKDV